MASTSYRPSVTDQHLQKYEEIMKTGTLNTGTPTLPSTPPTEGEQKPTQGKISGMLASIPKVKGIGNKMFIFNGKKKIIMDGGEKEIENAKTIDAKEIKKIQKEEEKKDEETLSPPPSAVKLENDKKTENKPEKKNEKREEKKEVKEEKEKKNSNQETPKGLIIGGITILVIWTTVWAYFLGYFSFLGL